VGKNIHMCNVGYGIFYLFEERSSACLSLSFFNTGWGLCRAGASPPEEKPHFFIRREDKVDTQGAGSRRICQGLARESINS